MEINLLRFAYVCQILSILEAIRSPVCTFPYECISSHRCAKNLSSNVSEVLFRCGHHNGVCCPPIPKIRESNTTQVTESILLTTLMGYDKEHTTSINGLQEYGHNFTSHTVNSTHFLNSSLVGCAFSNETSLAAHKNIKLLPSSCGFRSLADRITEGEEAELGEFPWMALIGYRDGYGNIKWICGGTLISIRYILTAAHCIQQKTSSRPVVRLGEHNLLNKTDCVQSNAKCLNPPLDVEPEEIKLHEEWNSSSVKNDIALIRLSGNISASYSVSPICLPLNLRIRDNFKDIKYEVAGWGKTEWALPGSNVLRKGVLSGISNEECNICKAKRKERYCPLSRGQMCAQGWKSVDVCKGDSGGPLMKMEDKMYQVGITSFKASEYCGDDNIPSVFTRIEFYMKWILDNLKK